MRIMAPFEGEGSQKVGKFDGVNFHLWKFKMEMVIPETEISDVVKDSEQFPHSTIDPHVIEAYNCRNKRPFAILALGLV